MSERILRPEKEYRDHLAAGRFMLLRDRLSGLAHFYPRVIAPGSGSSNLEWVEASGRGVIYSFTLIYPRPPAAPYNVVLVDLEEGPRVMSRVDGIALDRLRIGMPVRSKIIFEDQDPLLVFLAQEQ